MIEVDLWTTIRNLYYNERMSQRKIARTLGIHRHTVKRAIQLSGGPRYERTIPYSSILAPFKSEIQRMVEAADGDIMATVIYDMLSQREETPAAPKYAGSYPTLYKYVRSVKEQLKPKEAFLRIETPPGFDAQCDWGKVDVVLAGEEKRVSMFLLTLSYSR